MAGRTWSGLAAREAPRILGPVSTLGGILRSRSNAPAAVAEGHPECSRRRSRGSTHGEWLRFLPDARPAVAVAPRGRRFLSDARPVSAWHGGGPVPATRSPRGRRGAAGPRFLPDARRVLGWHAPPLVSCQMHIPGARGCVSGRVSCQLLIVVLQIVPMAASGGETMATRS